MCLKQVENARNMCIGAILLINFVPKAKFIFILEPEFLSWTGSTVWGSVWLYI